MESTTLEDYVGGLSLVLFFTKYFLCLFHFGKNISKFKGITTLTRKQKDSLLKIHSE
jgi:hypothetical protein